MSLFVSLVVFFLIPLCLFKFMLNFNHLLVSLLTLELISLSFFFVYVLSMQVFHLEVFFLLYFLVMVVREGVLGLSLLILLSFHYGEDSVFVFNKLIC